MKGKAVNMNYELKKGYFEISKGGLSSSIYFYQISDGDKKVSTGKIIIR